MTASNEAGGRGAGIGASAAHGAVTAVVLAARGNVRLERTLASLTWVGEPIVLDPAGRLAGRQPVLAGARYAASADLDGLSMRRWVLLVAEGEVVAPALARAVEEAVGAGEERAYRIPLELHGQGAILLPRRAPIRLARAAGTRLRLQRGLGPALAVPRQPTTALGVPLAVHTAGSLSEMVNDLDAEGTTLAALLHARRIRPGRRRAMSAALAAAAALLTARHAARAPWARWALAVSAGYRGVVTYAKVWELARADGTTA